MIGTYFYTGGHRILKSTINVITITITMRGLVVFLWCGACALRGLEKENLTFQRYVVTDAKRQQTDCCIPPLRLSGLECGPFSSTDLT